MKPRLLLFVLAAQCLWILGTVAVQESRLRSDVVVLLETRPVDPRDLLRGDYVILGYALSDIPRELFQGPAFEQPGADTPVYVALAKQGDFHVAAAAYLQKPKDESRPVLRGRVVHSRWAAGQPNTVRLEYGIERFYVREGTGEPRGKLTVEAAIAPEGQAVIRQVYLDGKPYAAAMSGSAL
jgi:uncharacterized membrane-anchored protein